MGHTLDCWKTAEPYLQENFKVKHSKREKARGALLPAPLFASGSAYWMVSVIGSVWVWVPLVATTLTV